MLCVLMRGHICLEGVPVSNVHKGTLWASCAACCHIWNYLVRPEGSDSLTVGYVASEQAKEDMSSGGGQVSELTEVQEQG